MTDTYTPFRIDTSKPPVEAERIDLFWIDDRPYTAPAEVSGPTALKALQWLAQQGAQYAAYMVLIDCIGQEAYDDLTNCEHLTLEQVRDMVQKITDLYFGQTLDALGK
jgi:hypothetical protein